MTDINDIFQKELTHWRGKNTFKTANLPAQNAEEEVQLHELQKQFGQDMHRDAVISIDETNEGALLNAEYGPQQVESLLGLVVDYSLNRKIEGAIDDDDAVRHLSRLKRGE